MVYGVNAKNCQIVWGLMLIIDKGHILDLGGHNEKMLLIVELEAKLVGVRWRVFGGLRGCLIAEVAAVARAR